MSSTIIFESKSQKRIYFSEMFQYILCVSFIVIILHLTHKLQRHHRYETTWIQEFIIIFGLWFLIYLFNRKLNSVSIAQKTSGTIFNLEYLRFYVIPFKTEIPIESLAFSYKEQYQGKKRKVFVLKFYRNENLFFEREDDTVDGFSEKEIKLIIEQLKKYNIPEL